MNYSHKPLYLDSYPTLDLFLVGYIAVRDIEEITSEDQARKVVKSNSEMAKNLIEEIELLINEKDFPFEKFSSAANIHFDNDPAKAKSWLLHMAEIMKEERAKISQEPI